MLTPANASKGFPESRRQVSRVSDVTAIVSDIHFPHHMPAAWAAFREWHRETRPARTSIGGDFLDLAQLSSFPQDPASSVYVVPEIQQFVKDRIAAYKYPRIVWFLPDGLPKGPTGKILKREIAPPA